MFDSLKPDHLKRAKQPLMYQHLDRDRIILELKDAYAHSPEHFAARFGTLAIKEQAVIFHEIGDTYQETICRQFGSKELANMLNEMPTDDAADFMIILRELDELKWIKTIERADVKFSERIKELMAYSEDEAGSLMELEIFTVRRKERVADSLRRLNRQLALGALERITSVFIVDSQHHLLGMIPLDKLILLPPETTYDDLYVKSALPISIHSRASVNEAVRLMERYDLAVLPVINKNGRLLGRITHDDVIEIIQENATRQMYGISQVNPEEEMAEGVLETGKSRGFWLFLNLINVTLVSIVIGLFEHTLQQVVALAVLMPIVANMAGTASVQTLTVVVRQMALGNLELRDVSPMIVKELKISLLNGFIFALLAMVISYLRFESVILGVVMATSMLVSFILAGLLGAYVPVLLKKMKIDPAIASSVIVMTLVDVIGFFSFLWFATLWIPGL